MSGVLFVLIVLLLALGAVVLGMARSAGAVLRSLLGGRPRQLRDALEAATPGARAQVSCTLGASAPLLAGAGVRCVARRTSISISQHVGGRWQTSEASEVAVAEDVHAVDGELRTALDLSEAVVELAPRARSISRSTLERDYPALAEKLPTVEAGWYTVHEIVVPTGVPLRVTAVWAELGAARSEGYRDGGARTARLGPGGDVPVRITDARWPALFVAVPYALALLSAGVLLAEALVLVALAVSLSGS